MRRQGRATLSAAALLAAGAAAGCGGGEEAAGAGGRPLVATTVAPLTSIVASVAASRARVVGIVPEGRDSHTFEPRPGDAGLLASADVVYVNGLGLDAPIVRLAERVRGRAAVVALGPRAIAPGRHIHDRSFPRARGRPNPHLWTHPGYALRYARAVRDDLAARDPAGASAYGAAYARFARRARALDRALRAAFATIPRARRRLLTYHDAYAYLARDYGWRLIGAIQVADFAEPSPREVARLIEQLRAERVPAIFGSEVFPSPVLERIAVEAGVRYVDDLRDDDLPGEPGDAAHSWAGLMRFNYVTLTEAMGGDARALRALSVRDAHAGRASYGR